jgi:cytochrome c biogenesis protein CcmG/thiol:disulfide interchange protein DsbE
MKRLLLALALLLTSCAPPTSEQSGPIESFVPCSSIKYTGMKADGLFVECLEGKGELALQGIEGPAVISVWASWCTNCEAQRENFIRLYKEAREKLQVIGIDVEEKKKSDGYNHALKKGMAYPQLYDPDGRTSNYFGPGVPITQFIDKNGKLAFQKIGPILKYEEMQELVKKYLEIDLS